MFQTAMIRWSESAGASSPASCPLQLSWFGPWHLRPIWPLSNEDLRCPKNREMGVRVVLVATWGNQGLHFKRGLRVVLKLLVPLFSLKGGQKANPAWIGRRCPGQFATRRDQMRMCAVTVEACPWRNLTFIRRLGVSEATWTPLLGQAIAGSNQSHQQPFERASTCIAMVLGSGT